MELVLQAKYDLIYFLISMFTCKLSYYRHYHHKTSKKWFAHHHIVSTLIIQYRDHGRILHTVFLSTTPLACFIIQPKDTSPMVPPKRQLDSPTPIINQQYVPKSSLQAGPMEIFLQVRTLFPNDPSLDQIVLHEISFCQLTQNNLVVSYKDCFKYVVPFWNSPSSMSEPHGVFPEIC